ncbi:MAG TPA: tRNA (adenine-N1)-methyltransferase [Actinomycetota bacterium]|nr:tRNA (adenine-N1)-methyltransferase [Actinomycetota bacterium]
MLVLQDKGPRPLTPCRHPPASDAVLTASGALRAGERVLLIDGRGRRYLVGLAVGKQFHSHLGALDHDELIGGPEGVTVRTSGGSGLTAFRPTLADYTLKMQRGAQVVYPKDAALMVMYADIFPGATVLEAGAGSGALTLALARAVGEGGLVISYEVRADHLARAAANVREWHSAPGQKPGPVELRSGDICDGAPERNVDRMVLDLPEPWRALGPGTEPLAPGGVLCCYLPTVPQVAQVVEAMRSSGFGLVTAFEALLRTWNVEGQSVRPDHRMVAHTGFIVTGRKLAENRA